LVEDCKDYEEKLPGVKVVKKNVSYDYHSVQTAIGCIYEYVEKKRCSIAGIDKYKNLNNDAK
jgi:hypothetical protein